MSQQDFIENDLIISMFIKGKKCEEIRLSVLHDMQNYSIEKEYFSYSFITISQPQFERKCELQPVEETNIEQQDEQFKNSSII